MNASALEMLRSLITDSATAAYLQVRLAEVLISEAETPEVLNALAEDYPDLKGRDNALKNFVNYIGACSLYDGLKEFDRLNALILSDTLVKNTLDAEFFETCDLVSERADMYPAIEQMFREGGGDPDNYVALVKAHNPAACTLPHTYAHIRERLAVIDQPTVNQVTVDLNEG